jgi:hypothetical protein
MKKPAKTINEIPAKVKAIKKLTPLKKATQVEP